MGLFGEDEHIHFKRNKKGQVIDTTRKPIKKSDRIINAAKKMDKKILEWGKGLEKKKSYNKSFDPFDNMFSIGRSSGPPRKKTSSKTKYIIRGGKAYPVARKRKKPRRQDDGFDILRF